MITRCTHGGPYGVVSLRSIFRATMEQNFPRVALSSSKSLTYSGSRILARRDSHEGRSAGFCTDFTVLFTQFCARSR